MFPIQLHVFHQLPYKQEVFFVLPQCLQPPACLDGHGRTPGILMSAMPPPPPSLLNIWHHLGLGAVPVTWASSVLVEFTTDARSGTLLIPLKHLHITLGVWLIAVLSGFSQELQVRHFHLLGCLSKVDSNIVFSLDVVDKSFYVFLIFCGARWTPLGEDGVFELGDVALEDWLR